MAGISEGRKEDLSETKLSRTRDRCGIEYAADVLCVFSEGSYSLGRDDSALGLEYSSGSVSHSSEVPAWIQPCPRLIEPIFRIPPLRPLENIPKIREYHLVGGRYDGSLTDSSSTGLCA